MDKMVKLGIQQRKLLSILKYILEFKENEPMIMVSHKEPKLGKVNHRKAWLVKKIGEAIERGEYNENQRRTFNCLRESYIDDIQRLWYTSIFDTHDYGY